MRRERRLEIVGVGGEVPLEELCAPAVLVFELGVLVLNLGVPAVNEIDTVVAFSPTCSSILPVSRKCGRG